MTKSMIHEMDMSTLHSMHAIFMMYNICHEFSREVHRWV